MLTGGPTAKRHSGVRMSKGNLKYSCHFWLKNTNPEFGKNMKEDGILGKFITEIFLPFPLEKKHPKAIKPLAQIHQYF